MVRPVITKFAFTVLAFCWLAGVIGCTTPTKVYPGGYLEAADYTRMQQAADKLSVPETRAVWERSDDHRPMPDYVFVVEDGADFNGSNLLYLRIEASNDAEQTSFDQKMLTLVKERLIKEGVFKEVIIGDAPPSTLRVDGKLIQDKTDLTAKKLLIGGHDYLQYEFKMSSDNKKQAAIQITSSNFGNRMGFGLVGLMQGSLESRTANLLCAAIKEIKEGKKLNAVFTNVMAPAAPEN